MSVFEDAGIQKALGRYVEVMRDEKPARFMLCKSIPARISDNYKECWEEHERLIKKFPSLLNQPKQKEVHPNLLELKQRIAEKMLEKCEFCERACKVNRKKGGLGWCRVASDSRVSSAFEHIGEEPELVPSGTIFFSGCNMSCQYCQNWEISQYPQSGSVWSPKKIAEWVEYHRKFGVRNLNLVGGEPTPNLHNILAALNECEVNIPVIWNSNMIMSEKAMELLNGVVDVYLADFKYGNDECARKLSLFPKGYWKTLTRNSLLAVEHAEILYRHLVLPNHVECCSKPVLNWIAKNLGDRVRVNIMSQYRPEYRAMQIPEISRRITREEYNEAVSYAKSIGLWNVEIQGLHFFE
ncbi:MAG: radical SAM protein [Candidatus Micrarchaeia archaeon]